MTSKHRSDKSASFRKSNHDQPASRRLEPAVDDAQRLRNRNAGRLVVVSTVLVSLAAFAADRLVDPTPMNPPQAPGVDRINDQPTEAVIEPTLADAVDQP